MRALTVRIFSLAALIGFGVNAAHAKGTFAVTLADFNSAQVVLAGGTVTVPYGQTVGGTAYSAVYTVAEGTSLELNSRFTITLPSGFTFGSSPNVSASAGGTLGLYSGGSGSQSATYEILGTSIPASAKLSIGQFALAGTTSQLGTIYGGTFYLGAQATNNINTANNDAAPVFQPAFTHAVGALPFTAGSGGGSINFAAPSYGSLFVAGGNDGLTIPGAGSIGTFEFVVETNDPFNANSVVLNAAGQANSLALSDTATFTFHGDFKGIVSGYGSTGSATCSATPPFGAVAATVTDTSLTITGVPLATPIHLCIIPDGAVEMQSVSTPYVFLPTPSSGVTDFYGGLAQTTANDFFAGSPETIFIDAFEIRP